MELNPTDIEVTVYYTGPDSAWVRHQGTGVTLRHKPSGIVVSHDEDRSAHRNKAIAYAELTEKVNAWEIDRIAKKIQMSSDYGKLSKHPKIVELLANAEFEDWTDDDNWVGPTGGSGYVTYEDLANLVRLVATECMTVSRSAQLKNIPVDEAIEYHFGIWGKP